jgi:hypothetical protein
VTAGHHLTVAGGVQRSHSARRIAVHAWLAPTYVIRTQPTRSGRRGQWQSIKLVDFPAASYAA